MCRLKPTTVPGGIYSHFNLSDINRSPVLEMCFCCLSGSSKLFADNFYQTGLFKIMQTNIYLTESTLEFFQTKIILV